jgi:hypothetical protein
VSTTDETTPVPEGTDIPTRRLATCLHCGTTIAEIRDAISRVLDWHHDGDYGCDQSPDTSEEGVGSHEPDPDTYWRADGLPHDTRYWYPDGR